MRGAAELVEGAALGGLPRQTNLVCLTMDRHHRADDLGERGGGYWA